MTLWEYLKSKMEQYADRIAFANSGLTYKDLLNLSESVEKERRFVLCEGETRERQALAILACIAGGNVAVPVTKEYGEKNYEHIQNVVFNSPQAPSDDLAFLMFTSGTTGKPKGVMLTHENIISNLKYIEAYFDLRGLKTICIARPLVHIAVLTGEILYGLCCGLTIYFYEESFIPQRLLTFFQQKDIDIFCATPTLYQTLAIIAKNKVFPIKVGVLSGEVLTSRTSEKITKAFHNTKFYNVYGLTEHSPRVSALLPVDFEERKGSVGKAIGDVELKIVNGELWVKSSSVMKGYYLDKTNTDRKLKDGWLLTGDSAHFDDNGYLYIDGRKDGMLIRAGINVYPEEIENVVKEIPGITDCLISGETTDVGTIIFLKYVGTLEVQELRKHLVGKMNPNIIPSKIDKVEELPRTTSGKKFRR